MDTAPGSGEGLFGSFKRLLRTLLAIAQNRLELLLVEAQEERARLFEALLLVGSVIVLALMTLMVATITIVALCLEMGRLDMVIGLGAIYLLATLGLYWRLRHRLKTWQPFSATLAELKKDKACSDEKR